MSKRFYLILAALLTSALAPADSIRVGDVFYSDVYIREGKDFYYVYQPEAGLMERVSKQRSNVSDLVISEDAAYREGLMAAYRAKTGTPAAAPTKPAPAKAVVRTETPKLDGDWLKLQGQMKDLAVFESQLAHWQTLPEDVQDDIRFGLQETLAQRTARRAADKERAEAQLQELDGARAVVADRLASVAQERRAAVNQAQAEDASDFYLNAYEKSKGYVSGYRLYYDECEQLRSIPTWWYTEDPSLYQAALSERARTDQRIDAAENTYAAQANAYGSKLNAVEKAMTLQERAARSAVAKSIDEQRRFGSQQGRAAALADATAARYQPRLRASTLASWHGLSAGQLPTFSAGQWLWRLDCRVNGATDGFSVTLHDAGTGKPFTRISGPDFLGMRSKVFDSPGEYYVTVEQGLVPVAYAIEVSTLDFR